MDEFTEIFNQTLGFEGGVDATDPKNVSNRGITQNLYNDYAKKNKLPMKDVKNISYGDARKIAKEEFYDPMKLDRVPSKAVREVLFDDGFNAGGGTAVMSLQRTVGSKPDGIIGKNTIKSLNKYLDQYGEKALITNLLNDRESRYQDLVIQNPAKYQKYINGWVNRVNTLRNKYVP